MLKRVARVRCLCLTRRFFEVNGMFGADYRQLLSLGRAGQARTLVGPDTPVIWRAVGNTAWRRTGFPIPTGFPGQCGRLR